MTLKEAYEIELCRHYTIKRRFFELQLHVQECKKELKDLEQKKSYQLFLKQRKENNHG